MKTEAMLGNVAAGKSHAAYLATARPDPAFRPRAGENSEILRQKFQDFVAGTFYQTMLAAMRKTVGKNKLVHGGRAEEIFRGQLDQTLSGRLAASTGSSLSDKLFEQFARQLGIDTTAPKSNGGHDERALGTTAGRPGIDAR